MKTYGRILTATALLVALTAFVPYEADGGPERTRSPFLDQELTNFLEAKEHIFDRAWARAVNAFKDFMKAYPTSGYRAEAGFWLAKALDGQAGEERTVERLLDRKTEAVEALDRLAKEDPKSPWLEEAGPFRRKLLGEIALIGGGKKRSYLAAFLKEENKTLDQARLDALEGLLTWERGWAAPVIEDLLGTLSDPEGRKTVLRFAGRFFPDETEALLREVAERDADGGVRAEAVAALERTEMARLPVDALFFVFSARLSDAAGKGMLPEMTAKIFDLPPASELNNKVAEEQADGFFRGKLRRLKMGGGGTIGSSRGDRMRVITDILSGSLAFVRHDRGRTIVVGDLPDERVRERIGTKMGWLRERLARGGEEGAVKIPIGDVTVAFPLAAFRKTPDSVSGQVVFEVGGMKHAVEFTVDGSRDQLAAFRNGNEVWLAVLQFEEAAGVSERGGLLGRRDRLRPAVVFKNVLGCRIESRRDSWLLEEIAGKGLVDFGVAEAEIPSSAGRWRLQGYLQADMSKEIFVGRNAELFDPSGRSVVKAAEIVVPAKAPDKYEIVKK